MPGTIGRGGREPGRWREHMRPPGVYGCEVSVVGSGPKEALERNGRGKDLTSVSGRHGRGASAAPAGSHSLGSQALSPSGAWGDGSSTPRRVFGREGGGGSGGGPARRRRPAALPHPTGGVCAVDGPADGRGGAGLASWWYIKGRGGRRERGAPPSQSVPAPRLVKAAGGPAAPRSPGSVVVGGLGGASAQLDGAGSEQAGCRSRPWRCRGGRSTQPAATRHVRLQSGVDCGNIQHLRGGGGHGIGGGA